MPLNSQSDIRRLAHRMLQLQALAGLVVALICLVWGRSAFISALIGAVTGVLANLYMTFRALAPARTPQAALGRLYFGQFIKVVVALMLFGLALVYRRHLVFGALLAAYLTILAVSWFVPFIALRGTPKS